MIAPFYKITNLLFSFNKPFPNKHKSPHTRLCNVLPKSEDSKEREKRRKSLVKKKAHGIGGALA